ncbi:coiled-coil domain-containing protein 55-domain containing protein [Glomus cerebriforme]|uniref:Coiled-coil domain-containing protein 55-domain containing protein n=1 Tax=Glomus cerebriforme TaxID=658196 RepID=A0A397TAI1_9GLOM|nr:coiled-coil domain-containing protein 55-domain containing protein [Glomus cerebriforme]
MQQNKQFKYGLNLSTKKQPEKLRRSLFTEDDDSNTTKTDRTSKFSSTKNVNKTLINKDSTLSKSVQEQYKAALEEDPTVYSYDEVYDDMKNAERKTLQELKGIDSVSSKKPRYINDLLKAAEIRKRDYIRAQERKIQIEREAEGEEFDDKETFVTSAYKAQQEELRKAEEEEKKREKDADVSKDTTKFYRNLLDQASTAKTAAIEASRLALSSNKKRTLTEDDEYNNKSQKTDKELAEEARASGKIVMLNDDDQIVDKRQLLSAGLNIIKKKNTSNSSKSSSKDYYDSRSHDNRRVGGDKSKYYEEMRRRERQSRELENQILETRREKEEEEKKKQEELAKKFSRKTDEKTISDAKARYLARQREKKELKKLKVEDEE